MSSRIPESPALPAHRLPDGTKETRFTESYFAGARAKAEQLLALSPDQKTQDVCRELLEQIGTLETNSTNNPALFGLIAILQLKVSELLGIETKKASPVKTSTYFDSHYYTP